MARGTFQLEVPGNALATVTVTMSVRDWQFALKQFEGGGGYESDQVLAVIKDAVRQAIAGFRVHIPEEDQRNG